MKIHLCGDHISQALILHGTFETVYLRLSPSVGKTRPDTQTNALLFLDLRVTETHYLFGMTSRCKLIVDKTKTDVTGFFYHFW